MIWGLVVGDSRLTADKEPRSSRVCSPKEPHQPMQACLGNGDSHCWCYPSDLHLEIRQAMANNRLRLLTDPMANCRRVGSLCRVQARRRRVGPIWLAFERFVRPHGLWVPGLKTSWSLAAATISLVPAPPSPDELSQCSFLVDWPEMPPFQSGIILDSLRVLLVARPWKLL